MSCHAEPVEVQRMPPRAVNATNFQEPQDDNQEWKMLASGKAVLFAPPDTIKN